MRANFQTSNPVQGTRQVITKKATFFNKSPQ